eukprot:3372877-Lingulodinium_polyedra.AAC.1
MTLPRKATAPGNCARLVAGANLANRNKPYLKASPSVGGDAGPATAARFQCGNDRTEEAQKRS